MYVANFKARAFSVQTSRPKCRKPSLVRQHTKSVGLIDHLAQLASAEEIFDTARYALGVHKVGDTNDRIRILHAHAFLYRPAKLQKTLAYFVSRKFVDSTQTPVAQVIDIIDHSGAVTQIDYILYRTDEIFRPKRHLVFIDAQVELTIQTESANSAQTIPVDIVEFFFEQSTSLIDLRRITRTQSCIKLHKCFLVTFAIVFSQRIQYEHIADLLDHFNAL